jgi:8-oxo-dGTP pyrophosphatase MutT (NUDIX family)
MKDGTPAWSVVVLAFQGRRVLTLSRGFNARNPCLPGGDSEEGDLTPAATAARELLEETGVQALELKCIDTWVGERDQPVYAFYAPRWKGKRLRTSSEGKPYWNDPRGLIIPTAEFRESAAKLFEKLGNLRSTAA